MGAELSWLGWRGWEALGADVPRPWRAVRTDSPGHPSEALLTRRSLLFSELPANWAECAKPTMDLLHSLMLVLYLLISSLIAYNSLN